MSFKWTWAGATAIGTAHQRTGGPCQDAFACRVARSSAGAESLIAALADGAGSAERAEAGARLATSIFVDVAAEHLEERNGSALPACELVRTGIDAAHTAVSAMASHEDRAIDDFASLAAERQIILGLKAKLDGLGVERAARLQALAKPVSQSQQRLTYLEQFCIEDAGLFNIGAARIAVLRSWGVETAAEIDERKISGIPGFGRNLTQRLVNWREGLEQRFHFEPAAVADPREVQQLDRELAARRVRYMKELRAAILALEKRIAEFEDERRKLWQRVAVAFNDRMLARHKAGAGCR